MIQIDKLFQSLTRRRPKQAPLDADDFPIVVEGETLVKSDGEPVATAQDRATAEEIADRLNEDAQRKEEDKWSA